VRRKHQAARIERFAALRGGAFELLFADPAPAVGADAEDRKFAPGEQARMPDALAKGEQRAAALDLDVVLF